MDHYMNPFWFVPMDDQAPPNLTLQEWGVTTGHRHDLLTGYIELRLKTLTPLHVAGTVEAAPRRAMSQRHVYRRHHRGENKHLPVVPGSSLRGMLRGYLEALTNGVASSFVQGYEKKKDDRHIGFWVGKSDPEKTNAHDGRRYKYGDRERVHHANWPPHVFPEQDLGPKDGLRVDPVTLMFGLVGWAKDSDDKKDRVAALKGRIDVEDAWFHNDDLGFFESLDLDDKAAFGGAKPGKSTWWYFTPGEIRERRVRHFRVAEFVGSQLRGRKFYFHQDPASCINFYRRNWRPQKLVAVRTEAVRPGAVSTPFRVHFTDLPRALVKLLLVGLFPSNGVRHKAGGLRPFGYGSIEFECDGVFLENGGLDALDLTKQSHRPDQQLKDFATGGGGRNNSAGGNRELDLSYQPNGMQAAYLTNEQAWTYLRLIGFCPAQIQHSERLFVYPPYRQGGNFSHIERGFARPVKAEEVEHAVSGRLPIRSAPMLVGAVKALSERKKRVALDLDYYQHNARNFAFAKQQALGK